MGCAGSKALPLELEDFPVGRTNADGKVIDVNWFGPEYVKDRTFKMRVPYIVDMKMPEDTFEFSTKSAAACSR